jgi:hypothetical protein
MRIVPLLLLCCACAPAGAPAERAARCDEPVRLGVLPKELSEASGLAVGTARPGVLWTHNDAGGEPVIFAIDTTGALLARVPVTGARNTDWEDITTATCPAGHCLYIADIGDNLERRDHIRIYRVPEPPPDAAATAPAELFRLRYPDRPRDAEAFFIRGRDVFIITKGRRDPVSVFRAVLPSPGGVATLQHVQELTSAPPQLPQQVTGAALAPDGRTVAVRTYATLQLYRLAQDRLVPLLDGSGVDLSPLSEPQGEAVAAGAEGVFFLASEARGAAQPGPISRLICRY